VETAATPDVAAPEAPPTEPSVPVEKAAPWPSFRGSFASGNADGQRPPLSWDVPAGRNVRFKTTVPGLGHSCPVVWGDRVYLTTAVGGEEPRFRHGQYGDVDSLREDTPHRWMALAYDRASGALVWERELHRGVPLVRRHLKGTHANCTPATDGKHLVVNLGSEGLYCLDPEGKTLWKVDLGVLDSGWFYDPEYQWGFGSSPVLHDGKVVIQVDIQEGSFIAAFDVDTGKELWRTLRDEIPSWGTPTVVVSEGRIQVVTNSSSAVRGYDLSTGRELWWLKGNSEVTVGTPVAGHGLIFFTGGYTPVQPIYAVRVGAQGDVTLPGGQSSSDAVAWSEQRGGTYMPTPIVYGDHLYTLANQGVLTCYDARTGKRLYRERIAEGKGGGYTASPVAADGRLYFTAEDGIVYVVEAGPEYRLLASNPIGEVCMATPAISDGMIYVRSLGHLLGLGREAGSPSTPGR
jgi:outer membrane protein assembly factor BamB